MCATPTRRSMHIQGSGLSRRHPRQRHHAGRRRRRLRGHRGRLGLLPPGPTGDGDPATSDGIFVFTGNANLVSVGEVVRVTGFAHERFNQTTINGSNSNTAAVPAANIIACGTGNASPPPTSPSRSPTATIPERYEGMLVRFPQSLVIAEYFNFDRFGEIVLAQPLDGEPARSAGTAIDAPGAAANARTAANARSRITLDDAQSARTRRSCGTRTATRSRSANRFRGGDLVDERRRRPRLRLQPVPHLPDRRRRLHGREPAAGGARAVGGTLRVGGDEHAQLLRHPRHDDERQRPGPVRRQRQPRLPRRRRRPAARVHPAARQAAPALAGLNGDIIGLNELENTPGVEPLPEHRRRPARATTTSTPARSAPTRSRSG